MVREKIKERFSGKTPHDTYLVKVVKKDGTVIEVKVISHKTENGHPTITGSILTKAQCVDEGG
jgi:hypothetical protein